MPSERKNERRRYKPGPGRVPLDVTELMGFESVSVIHRLKTLKILKSF